MTTAVSGAAAPALAFVTALRSLDSASLRILRQAAGKALGADLSSYDVFNEVWRPLRRKHPVSRLACWQVATLYPWHPQPGGRGSLGMNMRRLAAARGDYDAVKTRLSLLLNAAGKGLDARLLDAVRMLAAEDVPLDWPRFLDDLSRWYAPGRPVQETWALDFLGTE